MLMGLHRDPSCLPSITPLQAEIRRRLWATILEIVVQSSLDSWMPPRISLDDFDFKPPSNLNDDDLDESTTTTHPRPDDEFTDTSIQLTLLESLPLRLRIVQLLNQLHSPPTYPRVLELSLALTEALRASAGRTAHAAGGQQRCTPFRRNLLDYLVRRLALPLHTFREGQRGALTAVGLELLAHVEAQRLDGTLGRTAAYRGVLAGAVREMLALAGGRVRLGETNVKSHMFLSMILAQVEAVEAGVAVEMHVARSARDSLDFCYGILSARAGSLPESLVSPVDVGTGAVGADVNGFENYTMYGMGVDFDWDSIMSDVGFS